jgi:hypothetical protein
MLTIEKCNWLKIYKHLFLLGQSQLDIKNILFWGRSYFILSSGKSQIQIFTNTTKHLIYWDFFKEITPDDEK